MSRLIEIQNICITTNKDEDNEYKHYYTMLDSMDCIYLDQNPDSIKKSVFSVAISFTHGPIKYANFDSFQEAQACYNAIKAAMISEGDLIPVIDLLSFVN